jgi:hypothetical protein
MQWIMVALIKNAGVTSPEENDDAFCLFEVGVCG